MPDTGLMTMLNKTGTYGPIAWFTQTSDNIVQLRLMAEGFGGAKVFNLSIGQSVVDILYSVVSPSAPQNEIFVLLETTNSESFILIVDITDGSVSSSLPAGDSTCLITGWKNFVAAAGPQGVYLFTGDKQTGPRKEAETQLPPFSFDASPVNGAFATGFPGDTSAVLAVHAASTNSFQQPKNWLRTVQISIG